MNLDDVTPLILTFNEAANIERTLNSLSWAKRIVVIDSGSTDNTIDVLAQWSNVQIVTRLFDNFASQCNFGLKHIQTQWTLSLDADYVLSPEFKTELETLVANADGFESSFVYCICGRQLKASLYPPRTCLFRTSIGYYEQDGHAHRLRLNGRKGRLSSQIFHDDRKSLSHWLAAQSKYADLEVLKLTTTPRSQLGWKDRLRKQIIWAAPLTLLYCLFIRRLILDGWPGFYYSLQRTYAELLLSLKLLEARLSGREAPAASRHQCDDSTGGNAGLEMAQAPTFESDQF